MTRHAYIDGADLQAERLRNRHTQAEAAAMIGATERAWRNWEHERPKMRAVKFALYQRLCQGIADHA